MSVSASKIAEPILMNFGIESDGAFGNYFLSRLLFIVILISESFLYIADIKSK